jgi:5-oxoprolinase (ATP-hydrolysing)
VEDNLADLRAQLAANQRGVNSLRALAEQHGIHEVRRRMRALADRAETLTVRALERMGDGRYEAIDRLDDGSTIAVRMDVVQGRAIIDFEGTAEQHPGNLNATPAIVTSAVMYVLRLLIGSYAEDIPLNEGIMRRIDLRLPRGLLDPLFDADPSRSPAVVGGNVETSQRIVDVLLKALGLCAASQGTMNNVLFGGGGFGYYETVCGGSGATPVGDGADAVHTHMTNTRITDPELLEHRYPVRLECFTIRPGSGGAGRHRGGDGVQRVYRFLEPMELSLLTQRRTSSPFGSNGGAAGAAGRQCLIHADGTRTVLQSCDGAMVEPGDRLELETPGGGGWGAPIEGPDSSGEGALGKP